MIDVMQFTGKIDGFVRVTADAWRGEQIRNNSYGVTVHQLHDHLFPREYRRVLAVSETLPGTDHDGEWYIGNADGKARISAETGLDSLVAVRLAPGLVADVEELFPWGGAVIDTMYGLIVAVSGFKEDEDVELAHAVLRRLITLVNRHGMVQLDAAKDRGRNGGFARFTRVAG